VLQDKARLLGVSSQDIATALNSVVHGAVVTQVRDDIYLIDVVVRARDEERSTSKRCRICNCQRPTASRPRSRPSPA